MCHPFIGPSWTWIIATILPAYAGSEERQFQYDSTWSALNAELSLRHVAKASPCTLMSERVL
ncbi:MAG: hypothetical protein CMB03_01970 [Euryarchaeota archaeon]|nr:hypothetical protein [Euryarchaeota archaeon]